MKSLTQKEAEEWCRSANIATGQDHLLRYKGGSEHKFFIAAPENHCELVFLARAMLHFRGEANFSGAMLWLRRWDIGSPQLVWPGWLILESIRRAHGDTQPLDIAPAQSFRSDEFVQAHTFLIQTMAFGWVAEFVSSGEFFFHFKDNRQVRCTARTPATLSELRDHFAQWHPTDEDPMVVKMAQMEKERRAAGHKRSR